MPRFRQKKPKQTVIERQQVDLDDRSLPRSASAIQKHYSAAKRFRPVKRPPMARLIVLDDGTTGRGESRRLRRDSIIGRANADIVIPHDNEISDHHAQIVCEWKEGSYRWELHDLESTNGTFVRVARCRLRGGQDFMVGSRRFTFQFVWPENNEAKQTGGTITEKSTSIFRSARNGRQVPTTACVVEQTSAPAPIVVSLTGGACTIGSDQNCQLFIDDDPLVDQHHGRLFLDNDGRWNIADLRSVNGIWVNVRRVRLRDGSQFQLGEQRFVFREC